MRALYALLLSFFPFIARGQVQTTSFTMYSQWVEDSFTITLTHVGPLLPNVGASTVYYLDASIRSGNKLRELLSDSLYAPCVQNILFVGVGYKGDNVRRRRRDFIPPIYGAKESEPRKANYGRADTFYAFLTQELIPRIDSNCIPNGRRVLIGHSYGGLFVLYALFQPKSFFQSYIAMSPSLWVNNGDIFRYEEAFHTKTTALEGFLYMSVGTKERMNHVLKTTRRMRNVFQERNYTGLRLKYEEHKGKGHHGQVPVSLTNVLKQAASLF
jgi:predicted alpha/beta superfamily hydrolase